MWGRRSVRYLSEIDCQQVRAGCGLIPGGGLGGRGRGSDPLDHSGMKIERMQSVSHHDQNSFRFPEGVYWSWRPPTRSTLNCQPQLSTSPSCQCPRWGCSSPPCFAGDQGVWRFTSDLRGIMYVFLFFFWKFIKRCISTGGGKQPQTAVNRWLIEVRYLRVVLRLAILRASSIPSMAHEAPELACGCPCIPSRAAAMHANAAVLYSIRFPTSP